MKKNIIVSIIALVLVAAAIVGMVALYRNIDEVFETDETTSTIQTSGNAANTEKPAPDLEVDFYIDDVNMSGWYTYSDAADPSLSVTTFFKVFECVCGGSSSCVLTINKEDVEAVQEYNLYLKISYDGKTWYDVSYEDGVFQQIIPNDTGILYVGYLHIVNCESRAYVLSDLNANFFTDKNLFKYELSLVTESEGHG